MTLRLLFTPPTSRELNDGVLSHVRHLTNEGDVVHLRVFDASTEAKQDLSVRYVSSEKDIVSYDTYQRVYHDIVTEQIWDVVDRISD